MLTLHESNRELQTEVKALRAYGGAQATGDAEQVVTADDGIGDQAGCNGADGLVVRVARWFESVLRR